MIGRLRNDSAWLKSCIFIYYIETMRFQDAESIRSSEL